MATLKPRLVIVQRETELAALLARLGTRGQIGFYLESRGQSLDPIVVRDELQRRAAEAVKAAMPAEWSLAMVMRQDLDRFLFFPGDVVIALGQDGLVANLAKYLDGQPVIGVAPEPGFGEGVLIRHQITALARLLPRVAAGDADIEPRTMIEARAGDGQQLYALNDLFIGHRSHQSARYLLHYRDEQEFQSSSGVVVATGTGLSGWARSIMRGAGLDYGFDATQRSAAFFAREPWPSRTSGDRLRSGLIDAATPLRMVSRINEGGVVFADGMESDFLHFDWGAQLTLGLAERRLSLVQA